MVPTGGNNLVKEFTGYLFPVIAFCLLVKSHKQNTLPDNQLSRTRPLLIV